MNGRKGDHPLTDMEIYNLTVYSPEVDTLVKEIISLGGRDALEARFNLFAPPPLGEFEKDLRHMLAALNEDRKKRGWEVE